MVAGAGGVVVTGCATGVVVCEDPGRSRTTGSGALVVATAVPGEYGIHISDIDIDQLMLAGASPRGMSMLLRASRVAAWLEGRSYVTPEDVQAVFVETIAHRLCYQPVFELRRQEISGPLMAGILGSVAAP